MLLKEQLICCSNRASITISRARNLLNLDYKLQHSGKTFAKSYYFHSEGFFNKQQAFNDLYFEQHAILSTFNFYT